MYTLVMLIIMIGAPGQPSIEWAIRDLPAPVCEAFAESSEFNAHGFTLNPTTNKVIAICIPNEEYEKDHPRSANKDEKPV